MAWVRSTCYLRKAKRKRQGSSPQAKFSSSRIQYGVAKKRSAVKKSKPQKKGVELTTTTTRFSAQEFMMRPAPAKCIAQTCSDRRKQQKSELGNHEQTKPIEPRSRPACALPTSHPLLRPMANNQALRAYPTTNKV